MDLSKLPKLSESPPPPLAMVDPPVPFAAVRTAPVVRRRELGIDVLIALIIGAIFLMQGAPFGGWLIARMKGQPYPTGVMWNDGRPVEFFDLALGGTWLYVGAWVLGVCLLLEAFLLISVIIIPRLNRGPIFLAMVLGIVAALANVLAAVMQVRAGFNSPVVALVGILIGAFMAYAHARHLSDRRLF